jgi:hypothetical protein
MLDFQRCAKQFLRQKIFASLPVDLEDGKKLSNIRIALLDIPPEIFIELLDSYKKGDWS